jgi:hypothetical protein
MSETEKMLKAMIKYLENKPLNPGPLESSNPILQLNWRKIIKNHTGHFGALAYMLLYPEACG